MSKASINITDLSKSFGTKTLFERVSFSINHREKVGLVGLNGCGKSTLLKIIAGIEKPDSGSVSIIPQNAKIGYLPQIIEFEEQTAGEIIENTVSLTGITKSWQAESFKEELINKTGLNNVDVNAPVSVLSGGERTRLFLFHLLALSPDFLILDEPTNFLDLKGLKWIEEFIKSLDIGVFLVSHDRYFLDKVTTKIIEIDNGKYFDYSGNYSFYVNAKTERIQNQLEKYNKQKGEIKRLKTRAQQQRQYGLKIENSTVNDFIRARGKCHSNTAKAFDSRIERIEKEMVEKPRKNYMANVRFDGSKSSRIICRAENISKSISGKKLFEDASFTIFAGNKTGILGENGTGKTTLLKILKGEIDPDLGTVNTLKEESTGYFSQIFDGMDPDSSIIDEMVEYTGITIPEARQILAYFLFRGDSVFKKVKDLSTGEKSRLVLACIKAKEPDILVLDEPTSHLDVDTTTILEEALKNYEGTIIIVTHDRFLLDNLVTRLLVIEDCKITEYQGNYSYYADKKEKFDNSFAENHEQKKLLLECRLSGILGKLSSSNLSDGDKEKLSEEFVTIKREIEMINNNL